MRLVGSCTTLPGASLPGQRKIPGTLIPPSHPPIAFPPMWERKDSYGWPETRVLFFPSPDHPLTLFKGCEQMMRPTSIDAVPAPLLAYSGIRVLEVSTVVRREVHQSVVGETERVHRLCHFPWDQRDWWELDLNLGHCYNVKVSVRPLWHIIKLDQDLERFQPLMVSWEIICQFYTSLLIVKQS